MGVAPIGVFDSGVGGLTVLREMRLRLPHADFVYIGDTLHAPYGGRSPEEIIALSLGLSEYILDKKKARGIVVACNTATAAAADVLRAHFPHVPIVAMEPAVKPAARATRTGTVGILATVGTLASARFAALLERYNENGAVTFITQPCPGLVEAIETGQTHTPAFRALLTSYVAPLLAQNADTLVLGCTHYPVLRPLLAEIAGPNVALIDTGEAVARRVEAVMGEKPPCPPIMGGSDNVLGDSLGAQSFDGAFSEPPIIGGQGGQSLANAGTPPGNLELYTTGDVTDFARAAQAILGEDELPAPHRLFWEGQHITDGSTSTH